MGVNIVSGATSDLLTVDPTSKAARVSLYASNGEYLGEKNTYRAATTAVFAAPAGTTPFFALQGSSSKIIRIQRIRICGLTLTSVAYLNLNLAKYSTAISGGTPTALTMTPLDSSAPAATASLVNVYTAAPTAGSKVGDVATSRTLAQATTAAAAGIPDDDIIFDFRNIGEPSPVVLRSTSEGIALYFTAAPATAVTMALEIEWTEE